MDDEPENVTVNALVVDPNNCAIDCELNLSMEFTALQSLAATHWKVQFIADTAGKRKIVELGATEVKDLPAGRNEMSFHVDEINVSSLSKNILANVGLLQAILFEGDREVLQVSMVTQVTPDATDGTLIRSVYNPLE